MSNRTYNTFNQWGGDTAPWHDGGLWIIGGREGQNVVALNVSSHDDGSTLVGTMTYAGEGPIGFRGTLASPGSNTFNVENQWGGDSAPWHPGGMFLLGTRGPQPVLAIDISSPDGGETLQGMITYAHEGPIGFKATHENSGNIYLTHNQWGGDSAPWHFGGLYVIGGRPDQPVVSINVESSDNGATLTGTMVYASEGPIGFRGTRITPTNYTVENQWGGDSAPWQQGGKMILAYRFDQAVVSLQISSTDDGTTYTGTTTYIGEGPIGFKAEKI